MEGKKGKREVRREKGEVRRGRIGEVRGSGLGLLGSGKKRPLSLFGSPEQARQSLPEYRRALGR